MYALEYKVLLIQFKDIRAVENLFDAKQGDPMGVQGYIAHDVKKDQVYSVCFESLDSNSKQVTFDYAQTKRQKHFTKGSLISPQMT